VNFSVVVSKILLPAVMVPLVAGLAIGLGTYSGGWRITRTMGKGIVEVFSPQGFAAETTSAAAILASSHMVRVVDHAGVLRLDHGFRVGKKLAKVRWTTARRILYGWLLTLPAAAVVGGAAAAVALTGTIGIILVFAALAAGSGVIYGISKRSRCRVRTSTTPRT
jgi:inorganic phosphate transporter, PiT family